MRVLIVAALAFALVALVVCADQESGNEAKPAGRAGFKVPKVFDFERFKNRFNKHYANAAEYLARQKVFLATAMRAYISAIKYKLRMAPSYSGINPMSDWTPSEKDELYTKVSVKVPVDDDQEVELAAEVEEHEPSKPAESMSLDEVTKTLEDIIEHRHESKAHEAIAEEIESGKKSRRKRDASPQVAQVRSVSVEELLENEPEQKDSPRKLTVAAKSNNPDYVAPEVTSQGDSKQVAPMIAAAASMALISGVGILASMMSGPNNDENDKPNEVWSFEDQKLYSVPYQEPEIPEDRVIVDHRDSGCFLEPKSQGRCGSCYIYNTMAIYEYMLCKQMGEPISLSEQYVIDCGASRHKMAGCKGGHELRVASFTNSHGLELSRSYPNIQSDGQCAYDNSVLSIQMGYFRTNNADFVRIKPDFADTFLKDMPLLLTLKTAPDFGDYAGGVHSPGATCRNDRRHGMVAVGMGVEDGREYYLIRNSHSIHWGQSGYYKLDKASRSTCLDETDWMAPSALVHNQDFVKYRNRVYKKDILPKHRESRYKIPDVPAAPQGHRSNGQINSRFDSIDFDRAV